MGGVEGEREEGLLLWLAYKDVAPTVHQCCVEVILLVKYTLLGKSDFLYPFDTT